MVIRMCWSESAYCCKANYIATMIERMNILLDTGVAYMAKPRIATAFRPNLMLCLNALIMKLSLDENAIWVFVGIESFQLKNGTVW